MSRFPVAGALALVAALTLAGCSAAADSTTGGAAATPDRNGVTEEAPVQDGDLQNRATDTRSVISTATLTVTVDDPIGAADDTVALAERAGGRVDSRTESPASDDAGRSSSLVVRVPATGLTEFLTAVKKLGDDEYETITSTDVTTQTTDLDARIAALDTSVTRLLDLLSRATDTTDLVELETALSARQAELDGLRAQQRSLADQVSLATVSVDFGTTATAPVDRPQDFFGGIVLGAEALAAFLGALLIGLGVALPWLVVPAIVAVVVVVLVRRRGAARRAAISGEPAPAPRPVPAAKPVPATSDSVGAGMESAGMESPGTEEPGTTPPAPGTTPPAPGTTPPAPGTTMDG